MKKIFRVFYSQIFNAFFPVLILIILNKIIDKSGVSAIFILINYANFYLLFTDYSSNVVFLKEALQLGGISTNTHLSIIKNINHYVAIKFLFLSIGFVAWIALCCCVPALKQHFLTNLLSYTFIIGYNLNFYWIYMSSPKEFYFIISNLFARLSLLILLLLFIFTQLNISWLMPIVGVFNIFICLLYFKKFCNKYSLKIKLNKQTVTHSLTVIKRDFNLMSSLILLMTPTNCLLFFLGYVQATSTIIIYGFAQQLFFGIRSLLSIFINSVYPGLCNNLINNKRKKIIFGSFYLLVITGCITLFLLENYITSFLQFNISNAFIFITSLRYFIVTLLILSINVPFMLWAMLHHILHKKTTIAALFIASMLMIGIFIYHSIYNNGAISIAKSVMIAEGIILIVFIISYFKEKNNASFTSLQQ